MVGTSTIGGINNYAYFHTLEQALAKSPAASSATARQVTAFLAALERSIPELPNVKGLASEIDGVLRAWPERRSPRGREREHENLL